MQVFGCETITKKKDINMFECMEIAESIYEGVVDHCYKKLTREDTKRDGRNREMRGEYASSTTYSEMNKSSGKRKKHVCRSSRV